MIKIYDKTGRLVIDESTDFYDGHHLTYEDWTGIFRTNFKELKFFNKAGELVGHFVKGED